MRGEKRQRGERGGVGAESFRPKKAAGPEQKKGKVIKDRKSKKLELFPKKRDTRMKGDGSAKGWEGGRQKTKKVLEEREQKRGGETQKKLEKEGKRGR